MKTANSKQREPFEIFLRCARQISERDLPNTKPAFRGNHVSPSIAACLVFRKYAAISFRKLTLLLKENSVALAATGLEIPPSPSTFQRFEQLLGQELCQGLLEQTFKILPEETRQAFNSIQNERFQRGDQVYYLTKKPKGAFSLKNIRGSGYRLPSVTPNSDLLSRLPVVILPTREK